MMISDIKDIESSNGIEINSEVKALLQDAEQMKSFIDLTRNTTQIKESTLDEYFPERNDNYEIERD